KCEEINSPRQTTDNNECYAIYVTLTALKQNVITKGEAREKLAEIGYNSKNIKSKRENFLPEVHDWLVDIIGVEETVKKTKLKK
ncbi:hypothetical protein, partial [Pseudobutyrivibrio sp.]|uniref:hypothetical protein n=1 Tax=Pseudobutyrivibrio sp. TaxID=2014367 RepID=UPI00386CB9AA